MDGEIDEEMRAEIVQIILATPRVQGFNDLRTYRSGPNCFVQFDLELDDQLSLFDSHAISEQVVNNLTARFANLDVMVHQEPVSFRHDADHHQWGTA
jgi:ferrous-iron efflux pump FieF